MPSAKEVPESRGRAGTHLRPCHLSSGGSSFFSEHCMSLVEDEDIASQANGDVDGTSIEVEREGIIAAPAPLPEVPPQVGTILIFVV